MEHYNNSTITEAPTVSIQVLTYNHENYIGQCLDGIIAQQTNFRYEILIGEDDSADNTRNICLRYAEKYPGKIRLFLRDRKDIIYIKGYPTNRYNFIETLLSAKGKYIALCDGDDYWSDPRKLQTQVDFMESNPDYNIHHHKARKFFQSTGHYILTDDQPSTSSRVDLIHQNPIIACTCLYRNAYINKFPDWFYKVPFGDWPLHLLMLKNGKIAYTNTPMSVYRIHDNAGWSKKSQTKKLNKSLEFIRLLKTETPFKTEVKAISMAEFLLHYRLAYNATDKKAYFQNFMHCLKSKPYTLTKLRKIGVLIFIGLHIIKLKEDRLVWIWY